MAVPSGTARRAIGIDQLIVLAALFAAAGLAWWWLVNASRQMQSPTATDAMDMTGMAGMAPSAPDLPYLLAAFLMWTLMMVAMMLPSAVPMILLYTRLAGRSAPGNVALPILIFASCYLLVWIGFSAAAVLTQALLVATGTISEMTLTLGSKRLAAGLLLLAAGYQLSPLKRACLDQCRSPLSFVMRLWRPGIAGALRLGFAHGLYCLGCCWLLMLLLFVGGVMNLAWVAALAIVVCLEKFAPPRLRVERLIAAAMTLGAAILLIW